MRVSAKTVVSERRENFDSIFGTRVNKRTRKQKVGIKDESNRTNGRKRKRLFPCCRVARVTNWLLDSSVFPLDRSPAFFSLVAFRSYGRLDLLLFFLLLISPHLLLPSLPSIVRLAFLFIARTCATVEVVLALLAKAFSER